MNDNINIYSFINEDYKLYDYIVGTIKDRGRSGRDRMVVGFATTDVICAYYH